MSTRSRALRGAAVAALSVGAIGAAGAGLACRYRRELGAAQARLAAVDRKVVTTGFGEVEYVERGTGEPVLVSHGIFQSSESVLLFGELFPGRRVIAPSRFGYLGSNLPPKATPAGQADAYAELLDALGILALDVVGISAGTTSVFQLVLRNPGRVKHLVVLSGNLPGSTTAVVQAGWARIVNRQLPLWVIKAVAPSTLALLAGVLKRLAMTSDEARFVAAFLDSLFPVTPRIHGVDFDAFVSNADVNGYPLEDITVPTLLIHAKDDPLVSYQAAQRAVARIPGARLVSLESGGHLMLGQTGTVRDELDSFLGQRATP